MKCLVPLLLAVMISSAAAQVYPETYAQRKARERAEREWAPTISRRYDLKALTLFLKQTVAEKKTWHDVDLTKPRLESKWVAQGQSMTSGDWSFGAPDPKKDEFNLSFSTASDQWLVLKCARDGTDKFRLVEIIREKFELVTF